MILAIRKTRHPTSYMKVFWREGEVQTKNAATLFIN